MDRPVALPLLLSPAAAYKRLETPAMERSLRRWQFTEVWLTGVEGDIFKWRVLQMLQRCSRTKTKCFGHKVYGRAFGRSQLRTRQTTCGLKNTKTYNMPPCLLHYDMTRRGWHASSIITPREGVNSCKQHVADARVCQ